MYVHGACIFTPSYCCYANGPDDISGIVTPDHCITSDPLFVAGPKGECYLSQVASGQGLDSPCVDAGGDTAASLGLDAKTTRTDAVTDTGVVDMGYHYEP
jgi:hypothetical protein